MKIYNTDCTELLKYLCDFIEIFYLQNFYFIAWLFNYLFIYLFI